jgi:hypothetical protein
MSRKAALAAAVAAAVSSTVARPDVPAEPAAVPAIVQAVGPLIEHVNNAEPWYRSRVTWGAIVSVAIPILGAFGVSVDVLDADQLTAILTAAGAAVGGILTLWGRWKAKRPIGR